MGLCPVQTQSCPRCFSWPCVGMLGICPIASTPLPGHGAEAGTCWVIPHPQSVRSLLEAAGSCVHSKLIRTNPSSAGWQRSLAGTGQELFRNGFAPLDLCL